jgi:hypothetical protein
MRRLVQGGTWPAQRTQLARLKPPLTAQAYGRVGDGGVNGSLTVNGARRSPSIQACIGAPSLWVGDANAEFARCRDHSSWIHRQCRMVSLHRVRIVQADTFAPFEHLTSSPSRPTLSPPAVLTLFGAQLKPPLTWPLSSRIGTVECHEGDGTALGPRRAIVACHHPLRRGFLKRATTSAGRRTAPSRFRCDPRHFPSGRWA